MECVGCGNPLGEDDFEFMKCETCGYGIRQEDYEEDLQEIYDDYNFWEWEHGKWETGVEDDDSNLPF